MIYFTRYHPDKSRAMLNLHYHELIGKVEEYEGKKYLMVDDYTRNRLLDKIKRIGIEKFDDTRILIDADDKFPDDIILENASILMICAIKDGDKIYSQLNSKEALYDE